MSVKKQISAETNNALNMLYKFTLPDLMELQQNLGIFFTMTKLPNGQKAFPHIDDMYTRKRIFSKALEYVTNREKLNSLFETSTLWDLLFPFLNKLYEENGDGKNLLAIPCVSKSWNIGSNMKTRYDNYRVRINNCVGNCGLWDVLFSHAKTNIYSDCDAVKLASVSKCFFNGITPILTSRSKYHKILSSTYLWINIFNPVYGIGIKELNIMKNTCNTINHTLKSLEICSCVPIVCTICSKLTHYMKHKKYNVICTDCSSYIMDSTVYDYYSDFNNSCTYVYGWS